MGYRCSKVMIRDSLIPIIQERYIATGVQIGSPPDAIVVFSAKDERVGDLSICDDGDEATVYIGNITHVHFNPYNPQLSQEEIDKEVTDDVLGFLEDMFSDKILLWKARESGSGGCQNVDFTEGSLELRENVDYFLWSGPFSAGTVTHSDL